MSDKNFSQEMKTYFSSLPSHVQKKIEQSDRSFHSLEELRSFVQQAETAHDGDCPHC